MTLILHYLHVFEGRLLIVTMFIVAGYLVEKIIPFDGPGVSSRFTNCCIGIFFIASEVICSTAAASLVIKSPAPLSFGIDHGSIVRALGLVFAWGVTRDFSYYWFHRVQHASPWLWAEHQVHHSEEHLNVTTGLRHHWLEMPLSVFLAVPLTLIFRPPLITVPIAYLLTFSVMHFIHMDVRVGFGKLNWLLANPQNHRIHHSKSPEHIDKNFAQLFPLWDVIFGTYYAPAPDEFPATGLASGERVDSAADAMTLPFRTWATMLKHRRKLSRRLDTELGGING